MLVINSLNLLSVDPAADSNYAWAARWYDGQMIALLRGYQPVAGGAAPVPFDRLVVEDQWAGRNGGSVIRLAQGAGNYAGRLGFPCDRVEWSRPATWKRALCGRQKTAKAGIKKIEDYPVYERVADLLTPSEEALMLRVFEQYKGFETRSDCVDAIGIGLVALGRVG